MWKWYDRWDEPVCNLVVDRCGGCCGRILGRTYANAAQHGSRRAELFSLNRGSNLSLLGPLAIVPVS
jgi:hypothetical protein